MVGEEEWTTVTKGHKRAFKRRGKFQTPVYVHKEEGEEADAVTITRVLSDLQRAVRQTDFWSSLLSILTTTTMTTTATNVPIDTIVCYGIGNFASSSSSRGTAPQWQLALALQMRQVVEAHQTLYFDPCTTATEKTILRNHLDVGVIAENERGKRRVDKRTVFFMPHCPLQLYLCVLWANWENLDRVLLVGNSLTSYAERIVGKSRIPIALSVVLPYLQEEAIVYSQKDLAESAGQFENAFNDTYVTWILLPTDGFPARPEEKDCCGHSDEVL